MTAKTAKVRNSERKSGKAWSKKHGAPAKVLSPEALVRRGQRAALKEAPEKRGPNITMPKVDWNWVGLNMAARWPGTRKRRAVDAIIDLERKGGR